jgi:Transposase DDE domain
MGFYGTIECMNITKDNVNVNKNKKKYKIKNWKTYNQALINRGSLTLWIADDIMDWWYGSGHDTYSDRAIEAMLTIQAVYGLPLRATFGFVQSIFKLIDIPLSIPDYTTISRRAKSLNIVLRTTQKDTTDVILDSTGSKVYGEGEWKVRQHGASKRRTWKKIHLGIDSLGEIRAVVMTENNIHDSTVINEILDQETAPITDFYGDGAYDTYSVYQALLSREVNGFHIPPQKLAKIKVHGNMKRIPYPRDENLRAIRKSTRKKWKEESGYHTRSLGETVMFRYKTTFGDHMSFRTNESQRNEVLTKCNILNVFHFLGVPESYVVT